MNISHLGFSLCLLSTSAFAAAPAVRAEAPSLPSVIMTASYGSHLDPPERIAEHLERAQRYASDGRFDLVVRAVRSGLAITSEAKGAAYDKARLELWAISWRDRQVRSLVVAGKPGEARDLMEALSESLDSSYARRRLESLRAFVAEADRVLAKRGSAKQQALRAKFERRISSSKQQLERAAQELDRSRAASRRTVYSARRGESALRRFRRVERQVSSWLTEPQFDPRMTKRLVSLRVRAADGAVRSMLAIANARTTQSDFREALTWVDRVLSEAPKNSEAKQLRQTILVANAASAPWIGWGPMFPVGGATGR